MASRDDFRLSVEDRLDIQELFARYAWSLDTGDVQGVLACFVEDGSLEHQPQGRFVGHGQIRRLLEDLWYSRPGWFVGRQHLANHFLITPEGRNRARVRAFFSILQHDTKARTNFVFGLGNWNNVCVKRDGRWWFESVTVEKWIGDEVPWVGEARARSTTGATSGI